MTHTEREFLALIDEVIEAFLPEEGAWHAHECRACGEIWEHQLDRSVTDEEYHRRHDCPKCGINERTKKRVHGRFEWPQPLGLGARRKVAA